jgi:hypothetical protein
MDKRKRKIREGETSQWIGEKDNQRRRDITMDKGKGKCRGKTSQWIREAGK